MDSLPPGTDLCQVPVGPPPAGVESNFVDPWSMAPTVIAISVLTMAWMVSFTGARIVVNIRKLDWSDACCVLGMIFSAVYASLVLSFHRMMRHQWDVPLCMLNVDFHKRQFILSMFNAPAIFFGKMAILLLYFKIFRVNKPMRLAIYFGMFLNLLHWGQFFSSPYYCAPNVGESWEEVISSGSCASTMVVAYTQGGVSLATDIYIFVLPIPMVLKLQMTLKKKMQLLAVFLTALIGIVASTFALAFRSELVNFSDIFLSTTKAYLCMSTENCIATIVSSMPAFASFFRSHVIESKLFGSLRTRLMSHSGEVSSAQTSRKDDGFESQSENGENGEYLELTGGRNVSVVKNSIHSMPAPAPALTREGYVVKSVGIEQSAKKYSPV